MVNWNVFGGGGLMFDNKGKRHLVKEAWPGTMVYIHPHSDMSGGGWAMVTEVSVKDHYGHPNVVEVLYPSGRKAPADEFMITEVRK
tara:strand:+ start:322 stop:579 length:258 start_codon:yes stop_codon:yes gene_type:complete